MKLIAPIAISVLAVTACAPDPNSPQNRTLTGALTGAAVGGIFGGRNRRWRWRPRSGWRYCRRRSRPP